MSTRRPLTRCLAAIAVAAFVSSVAAPALAAAGALDPTFDGDGRQTTDIAGGDDHGNAVAVQADGNVVVVGSSFATFVVLRYTTAGQLDPTFSGDGIATADFGADAQAYAVAIQTDGKIVVAGQVTDATTDYALARFLTNGTLDTSFDGDGLVVTPIGPPSGARAVAVQPNGKIVAAGFSGSDFSAVRYTAKGWVDPKFNQIGVSIVNVGPSDEAFAVLVSPADGKVVLVGTSSTDDGVNENFGLVRLRQNGTLDRTFDGDGIVRTSFGAGLDSLAFGALRQPDGRIVVAGRVSAGDGNFALARYNTDGSLDASFELDGKLQTTFGGTDGANAVALQANGDIVAAGSTNASGTARFALVRYLPNGTGDPAFGTDGKVTTSFSNAVVAAGVAVSPLDGKIVAAGATTTDLVVYDIAVVRYLAA